VKAQRDAHFLTDQTRTPSDRVSFSLKLPSWIFVIFLNGGLLFYVYLFAMKQPHSRQSAWFQSFAIWLLFEIFISSTGLVFFFHLLIPIDVLTEVKHLKEKVLLSLMLFRKKYMRDRHRQRKNVRQRQSASWSREERSRLQQSGEQHPTHAMNEKEDEEMTTTHFNSAKYLFTSWRVAALLPELPESELILQFHTPWPRKKFGVAEAEVAREYDQAILVCSCSS
jgi:hypothetical protein